MTLTEAYMRDNIFVDFGAEVLYGSDQVYMSYPCRFATVSFQLMATNLLDQIADRVRKDQGYAPLHPMDEYTEEFCDQEAWYDFFVFLNDFCESHVDSCIEFVVVNSNSLDNEAIYRIDLSEEEQNALFTRLDEQCRKYLGKGCEELLAESRKEMEYEP